MIEKTYFAEWSKAVRGQEKVLKTLKPYVDAALANLAPFGRPAGMFFLAGKTGVGKTHTVEMLAYALHGKKSSYIRLDCGEFQSEHEVAKLLGAPPGYTGHRETVPAITASKMKAVTSENCGIPIILFDEIEKANDSIFKSLLGVMDRGVLTLGDNSKVNFKNCLLFFTSNVGFSNRESIGFVPESRNEGKFHSALKEKFSPEFLNRLDEVILFNDLTIDDFKDLIQMEVNTLQADLSRRSPNFETVSLSPAAMKHILDSITTTAGGGRNLKRLFNTIVRKPIVEKLLHNNTCVSDFMVSYENGEVVVDAKEADLTDLIVSKLKIKKAS